MFFTSDKDNVTAIKNEAAFYYTPVFEKIDPAKEINKPHTWQWIQNRNVCRMFYASPELLFRDEESKGAHGCYKILLSGEQIQHLKPREPSDGAVLGIPITPAQVYSYISNTNAGLLEYNNPFKQQEIEKKLNNVSS